MQPERWREAEKLFELGLEANADERACILAGAPPDVADVVRELWAKQTEVGSFLEHPVVKPSEAVRQFADGQVLGGRFKIEALLGAGGMGEVYRALDERLGRHVAIKVLLEHLISDPELRSRFEGEARAICSLNHPRICSLHDVGWEGNKPFLVMEHLSGETLAARLARAGRMPLQELLPVGEGIADALAYAHEHGVVHRDLKPGNIMLTEHGPKLLDFGIAKRVVAEGEQATTVTQTEAGTLVGSPAYMSPEQAEGRQTDQRSDIFSFGAVVYEMATGRRAFQGDTHMSTLAAVLEKEPAPIRTVVPASPPALDALVQRCLMKRREDRYATVREVKEALHGLAKPVGRRWRAAAGIAGATAVALLAAFAGGSRIWEGPRKPVGTPTIVPLTSYVGTEHCPTFSPDSRQVAFSWDGTPNNFDIHVKLIGSEPPLRITTDPGYDTAPAWSPDGYWIAFARKEHRAYDRWKVILVPSLGGAERVIDDLESGTCGPAIDWSGDGKHLIVPAREGETGPASLWALSIADGTRRQLTKLAGDGGDCHPAVSQDGRSIAFNRIARGSKPSVMTAAIAPDGEILGEPQNVESPKSCFWLAWTVDKNGIICSATGETRSLWRLGTAPGTTPEQLPFGEEGLATTIARTGSRMAFSKRRVDIDIWRVPARKAEGGAGPSKFLVSTRHDRSPQYSPDGRHVAFVSNRGGQFEIWVAGADGNKPRQVTSAGDEDISGPQWSPDGKSLVYTVGNRLFTIDTQGGPAKLLTGSPALGTAGYSPDGHSIYFCSQRTGRPEIWRVGTTGGEPVQVTRNGGRSPRVSPDGRRVFYIRNTRSRQALEWMTLPDGEPHFVTGLFAQHVRAEAFVLDGQMVYFLHGDGLDSPTKILQHDISTGRTRTVTKLGKALRWASWGLTLSPDRRWFLYSMYEFDSDLTLVENFR